MKEKIKKGLIIAIALVVALTIYAMPTTSPARADSGDPAMSMGAGALKKGAGDLYYSAKTAQELWYGGREWYVMGYDNKGVNWKRTNAVTLWQKWIYETSEQSTGWYYFNSKLHSAALSLLFGGSKAIFSENEDAAMMARNIKEDGSSTKNMDQKIWIPTADEVYNADDGYRTVVKSRFERYDYWTRTTGNGKSLWKFVTGYGDIGEFDVNQNTDYRIKGVRPAFDLDKNKVLFTSAAKGGKVSGALGANALQPVGKNASNQWKVTLKDGSSFSATAEDQGEGILRIRYSGDNGDKRYVSGILTDQAGNIKYYGRLAGFDESNPTCTVNLGGMFDKTDKFYVFSEQYNGDEKTDYASELVPIDILPSYDWNFYGFTWTGNEDDGYTSVKAMYTHPYGTGSLRFKEVPAEFTENEIAPTCEAEGQTDYRATISAEKSPDNQEHSSNTMIAKETQKLGHNWEFDGFTWTGDETNGYTAARANYTCKNDSSHTQSVDAAIRSTIVEATCESGGKTTYEAVVAEGASPDKYAHSESKEAKVTAALGHDWGEWEMETPATESSAGTEKRTCHNSCGAEDVRVVPPFGHIHQLGQKVNQVDPGCESQGMGEYYHCSDPNCGSLLVEEDGTIHETSEGVLRILATGHKAGTPKKGTVTASTCVEHGGYTLTTKCEKCGAVLGSPQHITFDLDDNAHKWSDWTVTTKPTAITTGEKERTCALDPSHTQTEAIPTLKYNISISDIQQVNADGDGDEIQVTLKLTDADGQVPTGDTDWAKYSAQVQFGNRTVKTVSGFDAAGEAVVTDTLTGSADGIDYKITAALTYQYSDDVEGQEREITQVLAEADPVTIKVIRPYLNLESSCADQGQSNGTINVSSDQGQAIKYCEDGADPATAVVGGATIDGLAAGSYKVFTTASAGDKTFYLRSALDDAVEVPEHNWSDPMVTVATAKNDGFIMKYCSNCHAVENLGTIAKIKGYKLSQTSYTYDGKAKKPTVTVTDSNGKTISASNYTLTYANNVKAGKSAKVTVTFIGASYTGTKTLTFTIKPASLAKAKVVLSKTAFTYNGKAQKPAIKTIKGLALKAGTDYTVKWSDASSKKAGTYTVTVTGKGNYSGTTKATYKINKAANTLKVKGKQAKIKRSELKKKAKKLAVQKVIKVTKKGQGKMSYKFVSAKKGKKSFNKYFKINQKNGEVTIKKNKKMKKGTYQVKVKVKAAGNANYKASAWKTVTFKVKVLK